MKSAIFQEQRTPLDSRISKKPVAVTKSNKLGASAGGISLLNWNLEEMISLYTSTGTLPARLSPKLPPQFENGIASLNFSDGLEESSDSDIDNTPMSLLSPTLPSIFTEPSKDTKAERGSAQKEHTSPILVSSLPKRPHTVSSALLGGSPKSNRVRWINKVNDVDRPRFLMRITFKKLILKFKSTFASNSSAKYHGLGIDLKATPDQKGRDFWLKVAKDIHSRNDKIVSRGSLLTLILQFDWILCRIIANDQDESGKPLTKGTAAEQHWYNLRNEIPHFIQRIEKYIRSNNVEEKKPYLTFLVGILLTMKALILKKINSMLKGSLDHYIDQKEPSLQIMNKAINLQKQFITNCLQSDEYLAEAQSFFSRCDSPSRVFPKSWDNRKTSIQRIPSAVSSPSEDGYFLPLGPYSEIRECAAYLYSCVNELLDLYEPEISGDVRYILQSGQKKG